MDAIVIEQFGDASVLQWKTRDVPQPNADQIGIKVSVTSVNFADTIWRNGRPGAKLPFTPGLDCAGVVTSVGANVRAVRDMVLAKHGGDPARWARPLNPVVVDGRTLDELEPLARPKLPPLLRGYLRLGADICGQPAHDPDFGVADFVVLLGLDTINRRYLERLQSAASFLDGR